MCTCTCMCTCAHMHAVNCQFPYFVIWIIYLCFKIGVYNIIYFILSFLANQHLFFPLFQYKYIYVKSCLLPLHMFMNLLPSLLITFHCYRTLLHSANVLWLCHCHNLWSLWMRWHEFLDLIPIIFHTQVVVSNVKPSSSKAVYCCVRSHWMSCCYYKM